MDQSRGLEKDISGSKKRVAQIFSLVLNTLPWATVSSQISMTLSLAFHDAKVMVSFSLLGLQARSLAFNPLTCMVHHTNTSFLMHHCQAILHQLSAFQVRVDLAQISNFLRFFFFFLPRCSVSQSYCFIHFLLHSFFTSVSKVHLCRYGLVQ